MQRILRNARSSGISPGADSCFHCCAGHGRGVVRQPIALDGEFTSEITTRGQAIQLRIHPPREDWDTGGCSRAA